MACPTLHAHRSHMDLLPRLRYPSRFPGKKGAVTPAPGRKEVRKMSRSSSVPAERPEDGATHGLRYGSAIWRYWHSLICLLNGRGLASVSKNRRVVVFILHSLRSRTCCQPAVVRLRRRTGTRGSRAFCRRSLRSGRAWSGPETGLRRRSTGSRAGCPGRNSTAPQGQLGRSSEADAPTGRDKGMPTANSLQWCILARCSKAGK